MNHKKTALIPLICVCFLALSEIAVAIPSQQDDPQPALPAFGKAEAMPAMDKLFQPTDGWIGGDGRIPSPLPTSGRFGSSAIPGSARFATASEPMPLW